MSRQVQIAAGHNGVILPNGNRYDAGDVVVLTDEEFGQLAATALGDEVLDLGAGPGSTLLIDSAPTAGAPAVADNKVVVTIGGVDYYIPLTAV